MTAKYFARKKMITTEEAARRQGVTALRIGQLCRAQRIAGARLEGRSWLIPEDFEIQPGSRGPALSPKKGS